MKCRNCKEDVPPKFAHAITVNVCPLCGQEIMAAELQSILVNLKTALNEAKAYPEEVEDWIFSNFSFKKIGPNDVIVNKHQLKKEQSASPEVEALLNPQGKGVMVRRGDNDSDAQIAEGADTTVSGFAKRAGVHKKAVDFIKGRSSGAADPSEFQGIDDEYGQVEAELEDSNPLNSDEKSQMQGIFNPPDLGDTSQELRMQKLKRLQSQQALENGGGRFRRV